MIQEIPIPGVLNSFTSGDISVIPPPEIFLSRYDLFVSKGIPTHVTTNLYASELEEKYGNRLRIRKREMFNLVAFNKNSRDKRS